MEDLSLDEDSSSDIEGDAGKSFQNHKQHSSAASTDKTANGSSNVTITRTKKVIFEKVGSSLDKGTANERNQATFPETKTLPGKIEQIKDISSTIKKPVKKLCYLNEHDDPTMAKHLARYIEHRQNSLQEICNQISHIDKVLNLEIKIDEQVKETLFSVLKPLLDGINFFLQHQDCKLWQEACEKLSNKPDNPPLLNSPTGSPEQDSIDLPPALQDVLEQLFTIVKKAIARCVGIFSPSLADFEKASERYFTLIQCLFDDDDQSPETKAFIQNFIKDMKTFRQPIEPQQQQDEQYMVEVAQVIQQRIERLRMFFSKM